METQVLKDLLALLVTKVPQELLVVLE